MLHLYEEMSVILFELERHLGGFRETVLAFLLFSIIADSYLEMCAAYVVILFREDGPISFLSSL